MNGRGKTTDTIEQGQYVVIQKVGGEHIRVMRLTPKQRVLIEKLKFEAERYGLFLLKSASVRHLGGLSLMFVESALPNVVSRVEIYTTVMKYHPK